MIDSIAWALLLGVAGLFAEDRANSDGGFVSQVAWLVLPFWRRLTRAPRAVQKRQDAKPKFRGQLRDKRSKSSIRGKDLRIPPP